MESNYGRFPESILNASVTERKIYFKQYIEDHPSIHDAVISTYSLLDSLVTERLIFVCGPSGVGKSEFIKKLKGKIVMSDDMSTTNPGFLPVVDVEACAPEKSSFDFDSLWITILEELHEPLINKKISYEERNIPSLGQNLLVPTRRKPDYLNIVATSLKYRRVKAIIIDEAHHMLRISSGKRINWSADILKTLVNLSHVPVILVGTYALLAYLEDLNPQITDQIGLRSKLIHIPRYHTDVQEEQHSFCVTAKNLYLNMPFEKIDRLFIEANWQYLYKYSLGRIGALKVWLMDAYSYALESKAESLTIEHLEKTQKPGHLCETELNNIRVGEDRMRLVLSAGNFDECVSQKNNDTPAKNSTEASDTNDRPNQLSVYKRNRKPFTKNPQRISVNGGLCSEEFGNS